MAARPRTARVLASLVASMTVGAIILLALDSQRPVPAGAFSLASYQKLSDIGEAIRTYGATSADRWNRIEVYYSRTTGGNILQLAALSGIDRLEDVNFHFVVYNGRGGDDGDIRSTEKWLKQFSCVPSGAWHGGAKTIRICVVGDGQKVPPTDCQFRRTSALVEELSKKFGITPANIKYPQNWQL